MSGWTDRLANHRRIAVVYVAVTAALIAVFVVSGRCWELQNLRGHNPAARDACVNIWVLSGVLLALSQIGFLLIAVAMGFAAPRTSRAPMLTMRLAIGLVSAGILLWMALFVYALSRMPS
jgi:hypothetical protein